MNIKQLLNKNLLLESGIKIPKDILSAKILHHDDYDGIMSAVAIALQLKKQGISDQKITTEILHDRDSVEDQIEKLGKRKNQMVVVVDFDRFVGDAKDKAKSNIDVQTDHHQKNDTSEKSSSKKSIKPEYGSDVLHISSTKAQNFFTGSDLDIMTGIDSAKFGKNVSTNIFLQKELKKNDGPKNKKMRLAIITSSIVGQLVRGSKTVNQGAIKSIIKDVIKSPSVIGFYNSVKKHVNLQKQQVQLLKAYEGKESGDIDWSKIEEYNEKVPKEMKIGKDRMGQIKKSKKVGRSEAASEEELAKRNKENQFERDIEIDPKTGKQKLRGQIDTSDMKPWEKEKFYKLIPKDVEQKFWNEAKKKHPGNMSAAGKEVNKMKNEWLKKNPERKKMIPGIEKTGENTSRQTDFKGNRYLAYEDPKVVANIRDFWKFWQMSMRPDYYEKMKEAAKKHGKEFNAEEIDLVSLGKESMKKGKDKFFTKQELESRGFDNVDKIIKVLNKAFDESYAKSGGHKSITNIDFGPIYGETYNKYNEAKKKAERLNKNKDAEKSDKLKNIEKRMQDKSRKFSNLLNDFKLFVQKDLSKQVNDKTSKTKSNLLKTLKEDIINNVNRRM